jgi:Kdo2-lipid IVA lauroyltransferase/acyltransferase
MRQPLSQTAPVSTHERPALWLRTLAALPFGVLYTLTALMVWVLRYVLRYRVQVARANLRGCFPSRSPAEIESLLATYYRHLGQVIAEFIKLASLSADALRGRIRFTNPELVHAETAAGRSVLLVAGHLGNWEWSLQGVVLHLGVPIDAAYKPLHSAGADRELLKLRSRFGARMVAAKKLVRAVARRRNELHAIALMADQIPASSGGRHWLRFFGRETAFYPGPGEIARLTGYAAFFTSMHRTGRGYYDMTFHPMAAAGERLEPAVFTERYAQILETQIQADPADWMWTHRRWKLSPPMAP